MKERSTNNVKKIDRSVVNLAIIPGVLMIGRMAYRLYQPKKVVEVKSGDVIREFEKEKAELKNLLDSIEAVKYKKNDSTTGMGAITEIDSSESR